MAANTQAHGAASSGSEAALLVIDMQNDFLLPGPLQVADGMAAVPKVQEAVQAARDRGVPVMWVVREHDSAGVDVELYRAHLYAPGGPAPCEAGTRGAELVKGLRIAPGERRLVKKRFSAFFGTTLDLILRRQGVSHVVLAGVQTPNCIRGTAWDAVMLDYPRITVLADATASENEGVQAANLYDMRKFGIATPTVAEWAAQLP